jgi:hypothetical protein
MINLHGNLNAFATAFSTISGIFWYSSIKVIIFYKEILKLQPIKSVGFYFKEKDFHAN